MDRLTRRQFLGRAAAGTAGVGGMLASQTPPAFAQKREVTMLGWSHFVPESDKKLKDLLDRFAKEKNVTVRSDHIPHAQLASKQAAELQTGAGHDVMMFFNEQAWRYREHLLDLNDVVDDLNKKYGTDIYPFVKEAFQINGRWKVLEAIWPAFPGNYLQSKFRQVGEAAPETWMDLLRSGKKLKKIGHPVGIAISHCFDANSTFWSVSWSLGAKVLEPDGKTIALNSPKMAEVIEFYRELYATCMEPDVLSWDDAGNNRCINSGHCAWIHNPVSPYAAAMAKKLPIADDLHHHSTPAGPAGRFFAPTVRGYGIWKFSKNVDAAKDLLRFLFREDNLSEWIQAGNGFNHPMWRYWEKHPVWASDPKLRLLPAEGLYARMRGWPAPPSDVFGVIDDLYILPDMVAKAIGGMATKDAMAWAGDQVKRVLEGARA
ncbi:MAG TPA: extracellular solute-binding protein [Methylomirabilota bacterium]|nr:extracellular solute-binding protein [Methylomirabilota bacterium]